MTHYLFVFP